MQAAVERREALGSLCRGGARPAQHWQWLVAHPHNSEISSGEQEPSLSPCQGPPAQFPGQDNPRACLQMEGSPLSPSLQGLGAQASTHRTAPGSSPGCWVRCFSTGRGVCAPSPAGTSCCSHSAMNRDPGPTSSQLCGPGTGLRSLMDHQTPGYDPSQQWDHVCQDTGRAGLLEKKVLLTPQQKQPKQQHIPENTARPHFRNVNSLLVFTGSFMSCFLHHHSSKTAMPTPFSPCTIYCYGFSVLCNPVSVRILLQFTLLLTSFNYTAHTISQTASPAA